MKKNILLTMIFVLGMLCFTSCDKDSDDNNPPPPETPDMPEIPPRNYFSTDFSKDGTVLLLQQASKGTGIDIVFMGDAFVDYQIDDGWYEQLMREGMDVFFEVEPAKSFRQYFNIYAVLAVSKYGEYWGDGTTAFNVDPTDRHPNSSKIAHYTRKVPLLDKNKYIAVVIVNVERGRSFAQYKSADESHAFIYLNRNTSDRNYDKAYFKYLLAHEVQGHALTHLADEYIEYGNENLTIPAGTVQESKNNWLLYGWHANVDFTNDPSQVKWKHFIGLDGYADVGVYESGLLYEKGV